MPFLAVFFGCLLVLTGAAHAQSADEPSSVIETYRDWTVRCVPQGEGRVCQLVQELAQTESGQRVLSFVIDAPAGGAETVSATLVTPFGLKLSDGISVRVDDDQDARVLAFSTCLPIGCVAPIDLDEAALDQFRAGDTMLLFCSLPPMHLSLEDSRFW